MIRCCSWPKCSETHPQRTPAHPSTPSAVRTPAHPAPSAFGPPAWLRPVRTPARPDTPPHAPPAGCRAGPPAISAPRRAAPAGAARAPAAQRCPAAPAHARAGGADAAGGRPVAGASRGVSGRILGQVAGESMRLSVSRRARAQSRAAQQLRPGAGGGGHSGRRHYLLVAARGEDEGRSAGRTVCDGTPAAHTRTQRGRDACSRGGGGRGMPAPACVATARHQCPPSAANTTVAARAPPSAATAPTTSAAWRRRSARTAGSRRRRQPALWRRLPALLRG